MSKISPPLEKVETSSEFAAQPNLTFCDYFAIIGFDQSAGLQLNKYTEFVAVLENNQNNSVYHSPFDQCYEARVLSHYPKKRDGFSFAYELCMPKGLKFYTERNVPKEPNFHSFVIVRENGTRVNGSALIFYEELEDIETRKQLYNMQMKYIRQAIPSTSENPETKKLNEDNLDVIFQKTHLPPGTVSFGQHTLPRKITSRRGYSTSSNHSTVGISSSFKKQFTYYDNITKPIFVSKCLCIITRIPIIYSSENFLRFIWSLSQSKTNSENENFLPIESYIYWALFEVSRIFFTIYLGTFTVAWYIALFILWKRI